MECSRFITAFDENFNLENPYIVTVYFKETNNVITPYGTFYVKTEEERNEFHANFYIGIQKMLEEEKR